MNEITIRSAEIKTLSLYILNNNEFGYISKGGDDFITDNPEYAFELYKLLKKADEFGVFDKFDNQEEQVKEILV